LALANKRKDLEKLYSLEWKTARGQTGLWQWHKYSFQADTGKYV
jgi:hypothetical protein